MNELELIVQRMIDAGESENNIAAVVKEYNSTKAGKITPPQEEQGAAAEVISAPEIQPTVTDSKPEDISLELQKIKTNFEQGEFTMAQRPAYEEFKKTGKIKQELLPAIKDEKKEPSIAESLAAKTIYGVTDFLRGTQAFIEDVVLTTTAGVSDILGKPLSNEEKIGFKKALASGIPGSTIIGTSQYDTLLKDIDEHVRKTENTSVTQALENKNYAEAAELAIGGALQSLPSVAMAFTGAGGLAVFGSSVAGNKFDEEFKINPKESLATLALNAGATGATEALFERVTLGIANRAKGLIGKGSAQEAAKVLKQGFLGAGKRFGLDLTKEGLSEGLTEATNIAIDNLTLGRELPSKEILYRITDGAIIGALMGGSINTIAEIGGKSSAARNRAEFLLTPEAEQNKMKLAAAKISNLSLDLQKAEGEAANTIRQEIEKETNKIIQIKKANSLNINAMNKEQLMNYAKNIDIINKKKSVKQPASAAKLANLEIKKLSEENNKIISLAKEEQLEKTTIAAKKAAEKLNINFNSFETTEQTEEFLKNKTKNSKTIAKTSDGFIIQNKDGSQEIVINKEVAKENDAVNVAAHELLHGVLFKTLKDNPGVAITLGDSLAQEIIKLNPDQIANSMLKRRLLLYKNDSKAIQGEEIIALFSDAVATGDIKYNENIFTKIGDSIRRLLQNVGFSKIKFNTGRDVYNFIKDYNADIAKGGIRKNIIEQAAKGFEGTLIDKGINISKEINEEVIKFSKSKASEKVQQIYEAQGAANAFDIIAEFKPIVDRIVNKYRDVPGFEYQLLKDEIETGKRGILDMIMDYTPEKAKGAPLAAYINSLLPKRAIEAANRILGTEFTVDVTEAKGVTDTATEEATEATEEAIIADEIKSLRKEIGLPEELITTVKNAVIKTFGTKLPNPQDPKFRLELQKRFRTELKKPMAKFVGKQEAYESFLRDNFKAIYDKLPQSLINRRFKDFAEPVLDKNGKQMRERTAEGNKIFTKKKITPAEFIKYFLGSDVGRSTQGTRKTAIVEAIAEEIAFDATMEVLRDPDVINKYQDIAGITGEVLPENFKSIIAKQIDRGEDFKFSKSLPNIAKEEYNLEKQELARILDKNNLNGLSNKYSLLSDNIIYEADPANIKFSLTTKAKGKWVTNPLAPLADYSKNYKFKVGNVGYEIFVTRSSEAGYDYEIFEMSNDIPDDTIINDPKSIALAFADERGRMKITGEGITGLTNQFKVFGTVANSVIDLIKKDNLNSVTFSAKEKSRQRLYQSLNKKFADELGWDTYDFEDAEEGLTFIAYNPKAFNIGQQNIEQKETIESEILRQNSNLKFSRTIENIKTKEKVKVKDILGKSFKEYDPTPDVIGSFEVFWKNVKQGIAKNYKTIDGVIKPYDARFYKSIAYEYWTAKKWLITHPQLELISNDFKGFDPTGSGDLIFRDKNTNRTFSVEVKMTEAAIMSTGSLRFENGEVMPSKNPIEIFQYIKNLLIANGFIDGLSDVLNATKRKSIPLYNITDAEKQIIDPIKKKKLNKIIKLNDTSNINNVYSKKGVDYFDIGGYIYTVSVDPMGFGAPKLNGEALVKARLKYTGKNEKGLRSAFVAVENKLANRGKQLKKEIKVNNLKFSKSLNKEFNKILEQSTGVKFTETFSPVRATMMGRGKGKKFFIPYSADDFVGLLYATLAKGKVGDQQMEWYQENLLRPFSRGIQQYEAAKQKALRDWMELKKEVKKDVPGGLKKQNDSGFTNQDSVRLYMWNKQGMEIPGVIKKDIAPAIKAVRTSPKLKDFAERLMALNPEGYPQPGNDWASGDITTDIVSYINGVKRSEFLTEWKTNVDKIFTDKNKNKLKALYGEAYVEALDNMLYRMENGRNRFKDASKVEKAFMQWTNNSVGAIMFFNARSAVLQTLSAVNFINFSDNNPINAGRAFVNQKQYWNDFSELFNSDFLKQRRTGLQTDVNADEIANAAATSKNKARAALSAILKFGFTPTQIADSFAIASGGATFYRNRINTYIKEGLTEKEAKAKAFTDFQEIAEETQQSARPDRISMQQAGSLGRLILAFGNTPMQYARLTKKATLDLINGRGDWKTNISKIAYYSVIQNIIFSALQQGLFALLFDDEDDEGTRTRLFRIGNSSVDTLLRGAGVYGAAAATVKNMILKIIDESKKSRPDYTKVAIEATAISPPINSKLRKLISAGKTFTYKQSKEKVFTEGFSLENPGFLAAGKVISAGTNLPVDRIVQKMDHINTAIQPETELWQSIALALGWSEWDLGMIEKQTKKSKTPLRKIKKRKVKR